MDSSKPGLAQYQQWVAWELGHTPSVDDALAGIASTKKRLSRLVGAQTGKTRKGPRPTLEQCRRLREDLHQELGHSPQWIETKVDCQVLLALAAPRSEDELFHRLIQHAWIEPTRLEVRRQQRPLIAALASPWGASVHAQMRELMLLSTLSTNDRVRTRKQTLVGQMQADLCQAQTLLAPLASGPSAVGDRKTCPQENTDTHRAFKGVRTGAMPTTRAVMAGLDRFYWGPTRVALYWATPKGVDLDHFGRVPQPRGTVEVTPPVPLRR